VRLPLFEGRHLCLAGSCEEALNPLAYLDECETSASSVVLTRPTVTAEKCHRLKVERVIILDNRCSDPVPGMILGVYLGISELISYT
jgi:hypothetical protein